MKMSQVHTAAAAKCHVSLGNHQRAADLHVAAVNSTEAIDIHKKAANVAAAKGNHQAAKKHLQAIDDLGGELDL
jgi:hypothetical protein